MHAAGLNSHYYSLFVQQIFIWYLLCHRFGRCYKLILTCPLPCKILLLYIAMCFSLANTYQVPTVC